MTSPSSREVPLSGGPDGQQAPAGRPAFYDQTVLASGLRVVTEAVPGVRSASVGVFVGVGSRDETPALHGCSHFLEHLLFKGTAERSALDISVALDEVGGEFNAFTAKEYTCFHARVLDDDLPLAVDVLGDMITSSLLTPADVEAERDVILDEIAMHDDDPDDVVHNLFARQAWGDTPLGRPIAGTEGSIEALSRDDVDGFYRRHYTAPAVVVAAAGNVRHEEVVALVEKAFGRSGFLDGSAPPRDLVGTGVLLGVTPGQVSAERGFEQVNLVLGVAGLPRGDRRRFALGALETTLGGGTSSRLFQEVRERRGLAYSVYSFASHHIDAGLVGVSVGCLPQRVEAVLDVVRAELLRVADGGITPEELRRAQGMLRGGLVLGLEDSASRMARIGKTTLLGEPLLPVEEVLARIGAVTTEEVAGLAAELFAPVADGREVLAVVGPAPGVRR